MQTSPQQNANKLRSRPAINFPHRLSVRVTAAERDVLSGKAKEAGLSVSRFLARTVLDKRFPPTLRDKEELFRMRFVLEKAAVNLNQIAHQLNAAAKGAPVVAPTLVEVQQTARRLKVIASEMLRRLR